MLLNTNHVNIYYSQDAFRRDFTINALFFNLQTAQVEDHTGKVRACVRAYIREWPGGSLDPFPNKPPNASPPHTPLNPTPNAQPIIKQNPTKQGLADLLGGGAHDTEGQQQATIGGVIRTPLPALTTFLDDPLRVLRAVRFAAR